MGGNGVLDLALRQIGDWAALWAVDPAPPRLPAGRPTRPLYLSIGPYSRSLEWKAFIKNNNFQDRNLSPDGDFLTDDEGLGHVETANKAFGADQVYDWLLTKQL
jgi:hypothetical protein